MLRLRSLLLVVVWLSISAPMLAFTIYLKDGNSISCKSAYQARNGKAYFTYENGTQGFIDLALVDVERTEEFNRSDIGTATVIEGATVVEEVAPPEPEKRTLGDLIRERQTSPTAPTPAAAEVVTPQAEPPPPVAVSRTKAGYVDLTAHRRAQLGNLELGAEILKAFRSQGVEEVRVYEGTEPTQPLVTVTANSEASVLRAVAVCASTLGQIRDSFSAQVRAFELLITTPTGNRAGQFVVTPEMADELLSRKTDITDFYVENVQF